MEEIKVKVIEGKVYLATDEDKEFVVLTPEEWESLDKTLEYSIQGENLILWEDMPETPQNVIPTLEAMYVQNMCYAPQMIEAMWDFLVTGNKAVIQEVEAKRSETRSQHAKLQG